MSEIKVEAFKYTLSSIDDGWLFESFAQTFLSSVFNYEFIPVGGSKDKGIDGLNHTFSRKGHLKHIYQISTEKAIEGYAATMRKFNDRSTQFYCDATGLSKTVIGNMMDAETWMTAQEAKDKGFIKNVSGEETFTQLIPKEQWLHQYQYNNMAVLNSYNNYVKQPATGNINLTQYFDDMKKFLQNTVEGIMNSIKGIKAPENGDHQTLMNSIAEAMQPLTQLGEQMDTEINNAITNAVEIAQRDADSPLSKLINTAVEKTVKNQITTPIADLVNTAVTDATKDFVKDEDLQKEITNIKGRPSNSKDDDNGVKPIGKRVSY